MTSKTLYSRVFAWSNNRGTSTLNCYMLELYVKHVEAVYVMSDETGETLGFTGRLVNLNVSHGYVSYYNYEHDIEIEFYCTVNQ